MPKMKTRSTAKKRFTKTSTGLIKRAQAYRRHLLTKKTSKRKRQLRSGVYIHASNMRAAIQLLANH